MVDWIVENIPLDEGPLIASIVLGIIFVVCSDFYHSLFSAVFSFFKK